MTTIGCESSRDLRHLARRALKKNGGFTWGRIVPDDRTGVEYRLFRRDSRGVSHMEARRYYRGAPRSVIARDVRMACRVLRDRVDELDLARMEEEVA